MVEAYIFCFPHKFTTFFQNKFQFFGHIYIVVW